MSTLTSTQTAWLRTEVGATPDDAALQVLFDDLASVRDVAMSVLRERRATLLASPLQVTLSGVASVNNSENVKALERRLAALSRLDDDPTDEEGEDVDGGGGGVLSVIQLTRARGR